MQILECPPGLRRLRHNETLASPLAEMILRALVCDLHDGSPAGAPVVRKRAYMDERLACPVTLAELAALARTSVRHLTPT